MSSLDRVREALEFAQKLDFRTGEQTWPRALEALATHEKEDKEREATAKKANDSLSRSASEKHTQLQELLEAAKGVIPEDYFVAPNMERLRQVIKKIEGDSNEPG